MAGPAPGPAGVTRTSSCEIEFWPVLDPSFTEGSRETRLDAYRTLRDDLLALLIRRFPPRGARSWGEGGRRALPLHANRNLYGQAAV